MEAATWLADRGFGRPMQPNTLTVEQAEAQQQQLTQTMADVICNTVERHVDAATLAKIKADLDAAVQAAKAGNGHDGSAT